MKKSVLIYTKPENPFVPLGWQNVTVLYYDGKSLVRLNFTEALRKRLPACSLTGQARPLWIYGVLFAGIVLAMLVFRKRKKES